MEEFDFCDILYSQIKNHSNESKIHESINKLLQLFRQTKTILEKEPPILQINGNYTIVGDIHGNSEMLLRVFSKKGYPDRTKYLFLGDYVDRGNNSVDVLVILFTLKCLYPQNIYMIRGNHECRSLNRFYGFLNECKHYYNEDIFEAANQCFDELPIAAILNQTVFCVHGGISQNIKSVDDLSKVTKSNGEPVEGTTETDFLWSDPSNSVSGYQISNRGAGHIFGKDSTQEFLNVLGLKLIVRSHETCSNGFDVPFEDDNILLTIFTSPDYCGEENYAGIVSFLEESPMEASLETFTPFRRSKNPFQVPSFISEAQEKHKVKIRENDMDLSTSTVSLDRAFNFISVLCS